MEIVKKINNKQITISLSGQLDTNTAPELEKAVDELGYNFTEVILDFTDLSYVSSAGLRVLLILQKKMNSVGTLTILNVNSDIMDVFEITGFSTILTIK